MKIQNTIFEKYKAVPAAAFGISAEKLQSWAEKMHLWAQKVSLQRDRNKIPFKYNMFKQTGSKNTKYNLQKYVKYNLHKIQNTECVLFLGGTSF